MIKSKHRLTNAEIEKDLIGLTAAPDRESKRSFILNHYVIPAIIACCLFALTVIFPSADLWVALAFFGCAVGAVIFVWVRYYYRVKHTAIQYYSITTETVRNTEEEHYNADRLIRPGEIAGGYGYGRPSLLVAFTKTGYRIANYTIHFENGKSWLIPKRNYKWHEQLYRNDEQLFGTIHREDTMIVVTSKKTGKIVMAYHTDFFEYKGENL